MKVIPTWAPDNWVDRDLKATPTRRVARSLLVDARRIQGDEREFGRDEQRRAKRETHAERDKKPLRHKVRLSPAIVASA